jgi:hypothetical protein
LSFNGSGIRAFNDLTFDRTNVEVVAATTTQEGTVSTGAQTFAGRKQFNNGVSIIDSTGGSDVALVVQDSGVSGGTHIQEWWATGSSPIAYLDTNPTLRIGNPGGADGFLELCSAGVGSQTVKLACGIGATQSQIIRFPLTFPSLGNILQVDTVGGAGVNLKWSGAPSGHTIMDEGTPLIQRTNLNFVGAGITAADVSGNTQVTLNAATATADGIVNTISQSYGGRKTFNQGATMIGLASLEPVLTCQLASGAVSTARLQEWRDVLGLNTLAYMDATPTFRLGSASFFTGQLDLCHASTTSVTSIRAAGTAAASYVYVLPANTPTVNQVLSVSSIAGSTINLAWATGGTGSGANIQLSNLDASGTAVTPSVTINTHIGFSADGAWNIGAPAHRVNVIYIKSAFFVYPEGSTSSSPKAAGFLDPAGGECTRLLIAGNQSVAQGGNGYRTQISAYHGIELRGNRRSTTAPTFTNIPTSDSSGVIVYQESIDVLPLLVNSGITLASDLFTCQNNFTTKFKISAQGTIYHAGGRRVLINLWQPFSGLGATTENLANWLNRETITVDTYNGGTGQTLTMQLPDTQGGYDGYRWHMIMVRRDLPAGGGGTATNKLIFTCLAGADKINNQYTSITVDAGLSGQRDFYVLCDAATHQWWISPCYI